MRLLGFQSPIEGAHGRGVVVGLGFFKKFWIHGVDLILLATEGGLEIFECAFGFDRVNLRVGFAAQLPDYTGMIAGVDLLGAGRGTKQAGGSMQFVGVRPLPQTQCIWRAHSIRLQRPPKRFLTVRAFPWLFRELASTFLHSARLAYAQCRKGSVIQATVSSAL